jgi:subtilase family serine protease
MRSTSSRMRALRVLAVASLLATSGPLVAVQQRAGGQDPLPNFDIRAGRPAAVPGGPALAELQRAGAAARGRRVRLHPHTGAVRLLETPNIRAGRQASNGELRTMLAASANRLGLERRDLESLQVVRDYTSASTGLRHVIYRQTIAGIPVFDAAVTVHIDNDGDVVRMTSSAGHGRDHAAAPVVSAGEARSLAAQHAPGRARNQGPSLVWFPVDGALRLAWHVTVEPDSNDALYDVLIDGESGELLLRRNRVLSIEGTGRVMQSAATQLRDPRLPDPMPSSATSCPPPMNYELRDLATPYRDAANVVAHTGHLEGNNVQVLRGNPSTPSATGTFDGSSWLFDFPFNSAGSAETALFFAVNFAHDFFYDLGFNEAAGNFQVDNFGRGGVGGDSVRAVARAAGRNNATFQPEPEGTSPIISMFLWDAIGCWGSDVDGDGSLDIDGDFDLDIILHEFHHGVSHRLNTAFTGNEADAIGEGASDFFAYSVNGDTTLAEYARPGGLRSVNDKTYGDWFCFFGLFCEPHANGEIFANVMWDVRERFRIDIVGGSEAAAVNETHQLYVDALKLSPPAPTMLDIRDAMLQADAIRNPGSGESQNFCRIWEEFAGRGMGVDATDTADSGTFDVGPDFSVPAGCDAPPPPPTVTLVVTASTATEVGPTSGVFTISRSAALPSPTTVTFGITGTATRGSDYQNIATTATIPGGAVSVDVVIVPINDTNVESNETVNLSLRTSTSYVVGTPSSGTVTIVSEDVAPDLVVSSIVAPATAGAGQSFEVSDTTKNQGSGAAPDSVTSFYLSPNSSWDAADTPIGSRDVPGLAAGALSTAPSTTLTIPTDTPTGTYYVLAKADSASAVTETSETNNVKADQIKIGPDLMVSALSVPTSAGQGMTIAVTDTTKNNGAGTAGASVTRFFLSPNTSFSETDTPLETRPVGALAAGVSSVATTNVTIPGSLQTGSYYLIAVADVTDAVPETSESNNTRYSLIRIGPDLQVSTLSAPSRIASGSTISVTDTTKNAGQASAGASTTAFYLSTNTTVEPGDHRFSLVRPVPALAAGAVSTGSTTLAMPSVDPGIYYILAVADDLQAVEETFEINNERSMLVNVGPDLDVTSITAPSTAVAGASITINTTVKNLGADVAPASTTRFYLSANTAFDGGDTLLGERAVPALAMNVSNAGAVTVTLPPGMTGRFYILAVADGVFAVAESTESNNTISRVITINP